jgi:hypothetical protein
VKTAQAIANVIRRRSMDPDPFRWMTVSSFDASGCVGCFKTWRAV